MAGSRRRPGAMAPFVEGYRSDLEAQGCSPGTVRNMLEVLGQIGRRMEATSLDCPGVDARRVEEFIAYREARWRRVEPASVRSVLGYLARQGVLPPLGGPDPGPPDDLLACSRGWLVEERGLAETTVIRYLRTARIFLDHRPAKALAARSRERAREARGSG